MPHDLLEKYDHLLSEAADELDITPAKHQQVVASYRSVGDWLDGGTYQGAANGVAIYPQGSFALGTVIKPPRNARKIGYDIDLVCQLSTPKGQTDAGYVKTAIGDRLKEHATYKRMLDPEGKRCWTLEYAQEGFHIDVLPSVAEDEHTKGTLAAASEHPALIDTAIAITNKGALEQYRWSASNPLGYAQWFRERNAQALGIIAPRARLALFEQHRELFSSVDDVPMQLVKTPLQQAVQVLKRHRDIRFSGLREEEYKPISMIITTLAGRLYNQEPDIYLALRNIVHRLQHHADLMENIASIQSEVIQRRANGTWYIGNPVNGGENFADRWHLDGNARAEAFFQWVSWVNADLLEITQHQNSNTLSDTIKERLLREPPEKTPEGNSKISMPSVVSATPKPHHVEIQNPAKPWSDKV